MAATVRDVLKVNIVLVGIGLLRQPQEVKEFQESVGTEMTTSTAGVVFGTAQAAPEPSVTHALNRDRITLELSPSRSTVNREYPLLEDLARMAEVAGLAISRTDIGESRPRAYGYNIELVFDQTSGKPAIEYLSDRLFRKDLAASMGWQPQGGAARLFFHDQESRWSLSLEPRFQDEGSGRVFVSANRHYENPRLPDGDEIQQALNTLWDQAHQFIQQLDGSAQ